MDPMRDWLDSLYSRGRLTFTFDELLRERDDSVDAALSAVSRANRNRLVCSPARGFYVIVPAEYRLDGAPPWQWYLDAMFRDLDAPYYAGLLTAAAQHGANAQGAQEVQVVTDRSVRNRRVGRQRLAFIRSARTAAAPAQDIRTPTGTVRVSTPEMTMLDLVAYPRHAGGWSNIASLLPDLAAATSRRGWREALAVKPAMAQVQRLGYLLDRASAPHSDVLAAWLRGRRHDILPLVPGGTRAGEVDRRWRVIPDPGVQAD